MWTMETPAKRLAEKLAAPEDRLPIEIMRLSDDTAAIVIDVDGVDYILTMARVPAQRARPVCQ